MAFWDKLGSRGTVTDRRGMPMRAGGLGLGGVVVFMALSYFLTGSVDVGPLVSELSRTEQVPVDASQFEGIDDYELFTSTVLGSTNDYWREQFAGLRLKYNPPRFVLFRGATESACGGAYSEYGPHYCPDDQTIYLDETFFDELRDRFNAEGDVAQAYVIAHEVGHHVQTILGLEAESIPFELQADCLAGAWAHSLRYKGIFEQGEISEALNAASAVGDDHIQEAVGATANPETWTHGSSEQRVGAFTKGWEGGKLSSCVTF